MAFTKIVKRQHMCGRVNNAVSIDSKNGRVGIPASELKYFDSFGLGGNPAKHIMIETDTDEINHKVRFTVTSDKSEYSISRNSSLAGSTTCAALTKLKHGIYMRVGELLYEHAGMRD